MLVVNLSSRVPSEIEAPGVICQSHQRRLPSECDNCQIVPPMEVCRALTEWPLATGRRFRACRVLSEASKCWGFRAWRRGSWVVMTSVLFFPTAQWCCRACCRLSPSSPPPPTHSNHLHHSSRTRALSPVSFAPPPLPLPPLPSPLG